MDLNLASVYFSIYSNRSSLLLLSHVLAETGAHTHRDFPYVAPKESDDFVSVRGQSSVHSARLRTVFLSKFVYEIRKKDGKSRKNIFGGMCSIVLLMLSAIVSAVLSLLLQSKPSPAFQTVEKSGGNICNIFP